MNTEDLVEQVGPSIAKISIKIGDQSGGGTGFMIRPGIIATNAHVANAGFVEQFKIHFPKAKEGAKDTLTGKLLYFDHKRDLAFFAVPSKAPPLKMADDFKFKGGREIMTFGFPLVLDKQQEDVKIGVLSSLTEVEKQPYFAMSMPVNPGNSGGPVFDKYGNVIGVVTLKSLRQEATSFCIPWQDLKVAISKVEGQKAADQEAHVSNHTIRVGFHRLALAGAVYAQGMQIYTRFLTEGERRKRPESETLANAKRLFEAFPPFKIYGDLKDAKPHLDKINTDPNHLPAIRQKMADLYKTYSELKDNVDKPKGPSKVYAAKLADLQKRWKAEVQFIRNTLDVEDLPFHFSDD